MIKRVPRSIEVFRAAAVLVGLSSCGISAAFAQTPPGMVRPLFGGSSSAAVRPHSLDLLVSVSASHDDDLGADQGTGAVAGPFQQRIGGNYSDVDVTLSMIENRKHFGVAARVASSLRHYPDLKSFVGSTDSAGITLTANVSDKTSFRTNVDASYVSSFALDTFSRRSPLDQGSPVAAQLGIASADWITLAYGGTAELTRTLGRRSAIVVGYGVRYGQKPIINEHDTAQTLSAQLVWSIGRDTTARLGYTFHEGSQHTGASSRPVWTHDAQAIIERAWRHSAASRTTLSLSGGPSLLQHKTPAGEPSPAPENLRGQLVRVVGVVALTHEISSQWSARASYRRGAGLRDVSIFSNTATVDVRGAVGRRVELTLSGGYTDGDVGLEMLQNQFRTSSVSARVQVALTRFTAVYGQGFIYHYDFSTGTTVAAGYPAQLDRRGLRGGVVLWMPVWRS